MVATVSDHSLSWLAGMSVYVIGEKRVIESKGIRHSVAVSTCPKAKEECCTWIPADDLEAAT